jgi:hypothetical protein
MQENVRVEYWWMRHGTQRSAILRPADHWVTVGYLDHLAVSMLSDERLECRPSESCTYCPARAVCPAWENAPEKPDELIESWVTAKERANFWSKKANALRGQVRTMVDEAGGEIVDENGRGARLSHRSVVVRPFMEVLRIIEERHRYDEDLFEVLNDICSLNEQKFNQFLMGFEDADEIEQISRVIKAPQLRMVRGQSVKTIDHWEEGEE